MLFESLSRRCSNCIPHSLVTAAVLFGFLTVSVSAANRIGEKADPPEQAPARSMDSPMDFTLVEVADPEQPWARHPGIIAQGTITSDTPARLTGFVSLHPELLPKDGSKASPPASSWSTPIMVLNSFGGALVPGMELGRMVRELGWSTQIGIDFPSPYKPSEHTICLSACTLVFLGGVTRYTNGMGYYGLHRFFWDDGRAAQPGDVDTAQQLLATIGIYVRDMGVDPRFSDILVRVGRESVYVMSDDELIRLKVVTKGYVESVTTWTLSTVATVTAATASVRPTSSVRPDATYGFSYSDRNRAAGFDLTLLCVDLGSTHQFQISLNLRGGSLPLELREPVIISANTLSATVDPHQIQSDPPGLKTPSGSTLKVNLNVPVTIAKILRTGDEMSISFGDLSEDPLTGNLRKVHRFNADLQSGKKEINAVLQRCGA